MNPLAEYQSRLAARRAVAEREQKWFRRIGNARLATAIGGVIAGFFIFGETVISPWWLAAPVVLFAALVVLHARVVERGERAARAAGFYELGIARLEDQWIGRGETGERFRNSSHVYQEDLDIFGKGSLFELLSTARTKSGEDTLAGWLLGPASLEEALARREAVTQLQARLDLREDLAVLGDAVRSNLDPESVAAWGEAPAVSFPAGARWVAAGLSAAVILTFGLYMASVLTRTPFLVALLLGLGYSLALAARSLRVTAAVSAPARDLELLSRLLRQLESETFQAPTLVRLQAQLETGGLQASGQIDRLRRLVSRLDWQRNVVFAPIAIAILWTPQVAIAIERWRRRSGRHIRG